MGLQIVIVITSIVALVGITGKTIRSRYYGNLIGLLGQPFWVVTTMQNEQWGIFAVTIVYGVLYVRGVLNNKR